MNNGKHTIHVIRKGWPLFRYWRVECSCGRYEEVKKYEDARHVMANHIRSTLISSARPYEMFDAVMDAYQNRVREQEREAEIENQVEVFRNELKGL